MTAGGCDIREVMRYTTTGMAQVGSHSLLWPAVKATCWIPYSVEWGPY